MLHELIFTLVYMPFTCSSFDFLVCFTVKFPLIYVRFLRFHSNLIRDAYLAVMLQYTCPAWVDPCNCTHRWSWFSMRSPHPSSRCRWAQVTRRDCLRWPIRTAMNVRTRMRQHHWISMSSRKASASWCNQRGRHCGFSTRVGGSCYG